MSSSPDDMVVGKDRQGLDLCQGASGARAVGDRRHQASKHLLQRVREMARAAGRGEERNRGRAGRVRDDVMASEAFTLRLLAAAGQGSAHRRRDLASEGAGHEIRQGLMG
ncbi:MAG: hypothetical protein R3D85_02730 [Paracoccaceae bacterium]